MAISIALIIAFATRYWKEEMKPIGYRYDIKNIVKDEQGRASVWKAEPIWYIGTEPNIIKHADNSTGPFDIKIMGNPMVESDE
jgi:hypothetical protein